MARSRRALLRKGNVTDIAEARKKREEKQQAREQALANARIGTLDEASKHADAIQAAMAAKDSASNALQAAVSGGSAFAGSAGGSTAGLATASAAISTTTAAHSPQSLESLQQASSAQQQSAAPDAPGNAVQPATRREHDQPEADEAARKKARADKKNANRTFNREKVEAIKKAIADGTYQINATRTANKFIERESTT